MMQCDINKSFNICKLIHLFSYLLTGSLVYVFIKSKNYIKYNFKLKKVFTLVLVLVLFFSLSAFSNLKAQDKGLKLTPAFYKFEVNKGSIIKDNIEIEYINFSSAKTDIAYKEFDSKFTKQKDSDLLKKSTNLNLVTGTNKLSIPFQINTQEMEDKTYFFGYQIILSNIKSSKSINEQLSVIIPIVLTVNENESTKDPKPKINIINKNNIYYDQKETNVKVQIGNSSEKLINFAGEIVFANEKDEIFYTQKVSQQDDRLYPTQLIEAEIAPDYSLLNKNTIPYFGKIKVYYRGTVNNQRHIQTQTVEYYLLPKELIVIPTLIVIILIGGIILIRKRLKPMV